MKKQEKRKIVVADDNKDICELLRIVLRSRGYDTETVNSGFALLAHLRKNQDVDVVVLDLMMPDGDGMSVFDSVRSISPLTKIMIFTAFSDKKNSIYARSADAFVEKDKGAAEIIKVLEKLLRE